MSRSVRRLAALLVACLLQSCVRDMATAPQAPASGPFLAPAAGSLLAYASLGNGDLDAEVVLIGPDGSGRHQITFGTSNWKAKWSPDGLRFVFVSGRDNDPNIFVMNADGSAQARLFPRVGSETDPTWSPDGRRIAFISTRTGDADLYLMNVDGTAVTRVVSFPGADARPDWSPDGSAIAFAHTEAGVSQLWRVAPDGSALVQLTHDSGGAAYPSWAPDGQAIAYTSRQDGHGEIYRIAPDGSDPRRLTTTAAPFNSQDPDWSPDGGSIAFLQQSTFSNSFLYVMNADGSEVTKVETGATANMYPDWRPGPTSRGTLVFLSGPPTNVAVGQPITPPIRVAVTDGAGNIIQGATDPVTILLTNPSLLSFSRAVMSGTKTVNAVDGVATFDDLSVDREGPGFMLSASAPELIPATSSAFDVSAANHLEFDAGPASEVDAGAVLPTVRISVRTSSGAIATEVQDQIQLTVTSVFGRVRLGGTTRRPVVNGEAVFDDLTISAPDEGVVLRAASSTGAATAAASERFTTHVTLTSVAAGTWHTCALSVQGTPFCWGRGTAGALGDSVGTNRAYPARVRIDRQFIAIGAGSGFSCGLDASGAAWCWGTNGAGGLGNGGRLPAPTPVPVSGGHQFTSLTVGSGHVCALATDGEVYCWGKNDLGQVGNGTTTSVDLPTPVGGGKRLVTVAAGGSRSCGIQAGGGAVFCWGKDYGALPARVARSNGSNALTINDEPGCILTRKTVALCWGTNEQGAVGDGTTVPRQDPTAVAGGLTFQLLSAGFGYVCGVTSANDGYCWGDQNFGVLGNGGGSDSPVPVAVSGGLKFASLSAGFGHVCGITTERVAYCWGTGGDGNLGGGTFTSAATPARVVQ